MEARRVHPLDALLLLEAASFFRGKNTQTFVQKVLFCAEHEAIEGGTSPFPTFPFFRWNNGPYSKQVANTAQKLAERGFMRDKGGPLTVRGQALLAELRSAVSRLAEAGKALELVDKHASRFARMKLDNVLATVYEIEMNVAGDNLAIRDIPKGTDLIYRDCPQPSDSETEQVLAELAWRLSQSESEEREESDSPLVSEGRARIFLDTYLS